MNFVDNAGREWWLKVDAPRALKVRERFDPEFLKNDFADGGVNTFQRLRQDPVLLCGVLYTLCEAQVKERGITEESFYLEVLGDAIDAATEALLVAIQNFTPRRTRSILTTFANQEAMQQAAIEEALAKVDSPEIREQVKAAIEGEIEARLKSLQTRLSSRTSSQAPSESPQPA